jgi:hypothetical protein
MFTCFQDPSEPGFLVQSLFSFFRSFCKPNAIGGCSLKVGPSSRRTLSRARQKGFATICEEPDAATERFQESWLLVHLAHCWTELWELNWAHSCAVSLFMLQWTQQCCSTAAGVAPSSRRHELPNGTLAHLPVSDKLHRIMTRAH